VHFPTFNASHSALQAVAKKCCEQSVTNRVFIRQNDHLTGKIIRSSLVLKVVSRTHFKADCAMAGNLQKAVGNLRSAWLAALLTIAVGPLGGPGILPSASRPGEIQENVPLSERSEEFTTLGRADHERLLKHEQRRLAFNYEITDSSRLGHTQNIVLFAPSGHRLSNGLLAPLTC
jgi:hypothetical protein